MGILDIILLLCSVSLIRIHKVVSTDIPLPHLAAAGQFHDNLVAIPDKDCLLSIHSLTGSQPLGIISKAYFAVSGKRFCQLVQCIIVVDNILVQSVVSQCHVYVNVGSVFFVAWNLIAVDRGKLVSVFIVLVDNNGVLLRICI